MDRRSLLKALGLLGVGAAVARPRWAEAAWLWEVPATGRAGGLDDGSNQRLTASCWITPQETEGPFYFDPALVRQDITESAAGVPLQLSISVIDSSCRPLRNVLVDVWHANKDGVYSGYNQPGGNTVGQTWLRGTQLTDGSGTVTFDTIYPGWYVGRATHIHFKARVSARTYITSQFAFPESVNDAVYASPLYAARGQNSTTNSSDSIFHSPSPTYLMVDLTPSGGGYAGAYTIGVDAGIVPAGSDSWGSVKRDYD